MPPCFPLTLACYAVACTLCFISVAQPQIRWLRWLAMPVLVAGLLCQGADIAWLCRRGQHPASSPREALYFVSFLLLLLLPLRTFRQPVPVLGTLLLPLSLVIDILVRVLPAGQGAAGPLLSSSAGAPRLALLHIVSATLGIALFGIAAAASTAYMLSERRLKQQRPRRVSDGGPGQSLRVLDSWNQQGIVFGLLAFTASLVSGTYLLLQLPMARGVLSDSSLGQQLRYLLTQPRYSLALVTWLLFAGLLVGRTTLGLRGRWAAQLTLTGFWTSLGVLVVYVFRDVAGGAR
jgi:ABC-type uncharacterized transport system permease subunit